MDQFKFSNNSSSSKPYLPRIVEGITTKPDMSPNVPISQYGSIPMESNNEDDDSIASSSSSFLNTSHTSNLRNIPHTKSTNQISFSQKLFYYIPCYSWLKDYTMKYCIYDLVAGLSLASYQIPLSMSFATAVAHVPPSCGLLGLSIGPMVYMIMGTVPQMIVGPEAAVSMIIGQTIERITKHDSSIDAVDLLSVLTCLSGIILFIFGILRFGFIDNVLCGTLLKGFITAIGLSMILNSAIAMLGLSTILKQLPSDIHIHSPFEKFKFLLEYGNQYHKLTAIIGFSSFLFLIILKSVKKSFARRKYKYASFFPEILVIVVISTILSAKFNFKVYDIDIVGKVDLDNFTIRNPFQPKLRKWYSELFPVAFICAILGFFETSTAGKTLSSTLKMPISSNRELVSLGTVGLTVSWFGALPSFGGYARSKLNSMNGAKTPVSGFFMGLCTLFVTFRLLDYLQYLPLCVLNAVIAVVGISLIEETPKELRFHFRTKGWNELLTFIVTLFASLFYSIEIGVAMGCFYSLMRVLKHSTESRIQILARIAGTDTFINSDVDDTPNQEFFQFPRRFIVPGYKEFRRQSMIEHGYAPPISNVQLSPSNTTQATNSNNNSPSPNNSSSNLRSVPITKQPSTMSVFPDLEDREGSLIVKVAEPLTFFNANDMKARLKRIELYGSAHGHPASAKRDTQSIRHVVFDLHGMTSIDSSATQILYEIVDAYQKRGINVFFCRVFKSNALLERFKDSGIQQLLELVDGEEFGIKQKIKPYYDDILDALKAIDVIESSCDWETRSYFSTFAYDGSV